MATGSPLSTDLVYLERDLVQYRISWYDFTNKINVQEDDLVLIQRDLQYHSVRVGDIWDGTVLLDPTDYFLVEQGVRGPFDPDNPDDPAYFGRLFHANPQIGVYIEFELTSATNNPPQVTIRAGASAWSNGMRPRIVTPTSGSHMLTDIAQDFTFQGEGVYGIMGYLKEFQISSPDIIDAGLSKTNLWHDMNSKDPEFGANLFSNIGSLTNAPSSLKIRNAWEFAANTNFNFGVDNPFNDLYLRSDESTNLQVSNAGRAFYNTTGLPGLYMANMFRLETAAEMFAESDFAGPFWTYGRPNDPNHIDPPSFGVSNAYRMFYNCVNYTGDDTFWARVNMISTTTNGEQYGYHSTKNTAQMFEGSSFNSNFSPTAGRLQTAINMHRMFARSPFNGIVQGQSYWVIGDGRTKDASEMFADCPFFAKGVQLDLSNVSQQAINVEGMFRNTGSFNYNFSSTWSFNRTKSLANMFNGATGLTDPSAPPNWDVSPIEDFSGLFAGTAFNVDISGWDTQNATNMDRMFDNATVFNFDLTGWCVPLIPDEPDSFADTSVFAQEKHPKWGTCPVPVVTMPKIFDDNTKSYTTGIVGNRIKYSPVGKLEVDADTVLPIWEQKKQGETDFVELDGSLIDPYDTRGKIHPSLENSILRVKEIHQSTKYDEDIVLYSNELSIGAAPARTFWTFDYTGDIDKILKVNVPYAQIERYDGANWNFVEYDPKPDLNDNTIKKQQRLAPGTYRIDTTFNYSWTYASSSDNFAATDLNVHNTSTLGAVTNMNSMFYTRGYKGQDFGWLDTSKVKDMYSVFRDIEGGQLDVSGWDVSNVTTLGSAFYGASKFTGAGLDTWGAASKATTTTKMFSLCSELNVNMHNMQFPKVTSAVEMFNSCRKQTGDAPGVMFTGVGAVNCKSMFNNCRVFNGDIGGIRIGVVTEAENMFKDCHQFNNDSFQDVDWTGQKCDGATNMFLNCYKFNQSLASLPRDFFKKLNTMESTFQDCRAFAGEGMAGFNFSNVRRFDSVFSNAGLIGDVDVSGWAIKTNGDVEMRNMFSNCKKVESFVGLPQWNTSRVIDMKYMFNYCELLHQDDMYELQVQNVTNMHRTFFYARVFNGDLSAWCVPKLADASKRSQIFSGSGIEDQLNKHPVWGKCPPRVVSNPIIQ